MKHLIIILLFISFGVSAQSVDDLFKEANTFYQQEKYNESLEKYNAIIGMNYQSSDLFYNVANNYYKLQKTAPAVLYYKKALKLNPNMDDAVFNLKMAKLRTVDKFEKLPQTVFVKFWNWLAGIMTVHKWAVWAVVFSFTVAFTFLVYNIAQKSVFKRIYFTIGLFALIFMGISILVAHQQHNWHKSHKEAVIMSENVYVKVAPNLKSDDKFILHEGTEVLVVDEVGEWLRIKLQDGKIGWINANELSFV